jgi:hypothetical protein
MSTEMNPIRSFFSDKHGKLAIAQLPNPPLIIWLLATAVAHFVHTGLVHTSARIVAVAAILVWAILEIISGLSPFRRILGGAVLLLMLVSLLRTL